MTIEEYIKNIKYIDPDREELLKRLEAMTDDDIDCSDIPEVTDYSRFRPAREHMRRVAEFNLRSKRKSELEKLEKTEQLA